MTGRLLIGFVLTLMLLLSMFVVPFIPELRQFNTFAIGLVLTLLFGETRLALIAAIVGGVLMDLISPWPFGTHLLAFMGGLAITRWISRTRVTNRSFLAYSSLILIGTISTRIFEFTAAHLLRTLDSAALTPLLQSGWWVTVILNLIQAFTVGLLMYIGVRLSGRSYATLADHEF